MDNVPNSHSDYLSESTRGSGKKNFFFFAGFFLLIVVLGAASYSLVSWYRDPYRVAMNNQEKVRKAYEEDVYGGKTPQETLNLFIDALRKDDLELASKYFALDDNLSRGEWKEALIEQKDQGRLDDLIVLLSKAESGDNKNEDFAKSYYNFVVYGKNGELEADINFEFNPIAKIWKLYDL